MSEDSKYFDALEANLLCQSAHRLNDLSVIIHQHNINAGWWTDLKTGESLTGKDEHGRDKRNVPEMLALVHSEISEGLEGYRKDLMDNHLPTRKMFEVEMADTLIRIFDIAGAHKMDLGGAVLEKLAYNQKREDHKIAARQAAGGKRI